MSRNVRAFLTLVRAIAVWGLLGVPVAANAQALSGKLSARPVVLESGVPNTVTVSIPIAELNVVPGSVNLLRILPVGSSIVGVLRDDGQNGDVAAGDSLYTVRAILQEPFSGEVTVQASAAIRGQLRRWLSSPLTIKVAAVPNLPPDPGNAGTATLNGIDSDADGVRDDLQRFIALSFPSSARRRSALRQVATSVQLLVAEGGDGPNVGVNLQKLVNAIECSAAIHGSENSARVTRELISQAIDTSQRYDAYFAANRRASEFSFVATPPSARSSKCLFDPSTLPD